MRRYDVVVFDLDGTLTDPLVGIGASLNYALAHIGHPPLDAQAVAPFIGPPLDVAFTSITGSSDPLVIRALVDKYRERYGDVGFSENAVYDGVPEMLQQLHDAGVRMGVCTSKRRDFAEKILALFGLLDLFAFVDGGDVGITKVDQMQRLCETGVVTDASIMVGDRAVDMIAAHHNGLAGAGVLWGYGSREELEAEQPQHLFEHPRDLRAILG
jgi:phosphoglycolate phosphatase